VIGGGRGGAAFYWSLMKISFSGSRTLATAIVAVLFGWAFSGNDAATLARYQKMTKDAVVADIASKHTSAAAMLAGCLIIILLIVVAVEVLTHAFDALGRRIGVTPNGSAPPTA